MNRSQKGGTQRKIELTSLVDVIFLLLIFFLVTLNVVQPLGGPGFVEGVYGIDAMTEVDPALGEAAVLVSRLPGSTAISYLWIKGQRNDRGGALNTLYQFCRTMYDDIYHGAGPVNWRRNQVYNILNDLELVGGVVSHPEELIHNLTEVGRLVVVCPETMTYGVVHEVIRACSRTNIREYEIVPRDPVEEIYRNNLLDVQTVPGFNRIYE